MPTSLTDEQLAQEAYNVFVDEWEAQANGEPLDKIDDWTRKPDLRSGATAQEMLIFYIQARKGLLGDRDFTLLHCEMPFAVPLTQEPNGPTYVGRMDKVFMYQGRVYIGEHKTTTSYKQNGPFTRSFVDSFSPNSQVDGYLYAAHLIFGDAVKAVWVDAALVHASVHDGFRFIPVERKFEQLTAWHWEALYWVEQIEANKRARLAQVDEGHEFLPAFPKSTNACTQYGNCPYIDLCKMVPNPERTIAVGEPPLGFAEEKWEPFDPRLFGDGTNIPGALARLSPDMSLYDNTRLQSYRTCARSYYFRHERDLRPDRTSRALAFGSAWHRAMEFLWPALAYKVE